MWGNTQCALNRALTLTEAVLCVYLQLVVFGGLERVRSSTDPIKQSTNIHVVDLSVTPLRWRTAPVTNITLYGLEPQAFPSTGAANVPGQRVIALKYFRVRVGAKLNIFAQAARHLEFGEHCMLHLWRACSSFIHRKTFCTCALVQRACIHVHGTALCAVCVGRS